MHAHDHTPYQPPQEHDLAFLPDVLKKIVANDERIALNPGWMWEGPIYREEKIFLCRAYLSPDNRCVRFTVDGRGPYQALTEKGLALGFLIGAKCPEWGRIPIMDARAFHLVITK